MPCNGDYLNATHREREISTVACLLDELAGRPVEPSWRNGYHPKAYGKGRQSGDELVRELCAALQSVDVTTCSLEMQMWWRDHQAADKARAEAVEAAAEVERLRDSGLRKLTPAERKALMP